MKTITKRQKSVMSRRPNSLLHSEKRVALVDAIDRVVEKGASLNGEIFLTVADIDLIIIKLNLMIGSATKINHPDTRQDPRQDEAFLKNLRQKIKEIEDNMPKVIDAASPQKTEQGFARLILTLVVLIKELMEREALRKIDYGTLDKTQVEKLGLSFTALDKKIAELKQVFGLEEDLNIDLGPLGKLL